jgi:hypothetical protein
MTYMLSSLAGGKVVVALEVETILMGERSRRLTTLSGRL